jgi:hypothetical protein
LQYFDAGLLSPSEFASDFLPQIAYIIYTTKLRIRRVRRFVFFGPRHPVFETQAGVRQVQLRFSSSGSELVICGKIMQSNMRRMDWCCERDRRLKPLSGAPSLLRTWSAAERLPSRGANWSSADKARSYKGHVDPQQAGSSI